MPRVILETQHGHQALTGTPDETVADVLRRAGIPLPAVWTYTTMRQGEAGSCEVRFVPSSARLDALSSDVFARANRNVDLLGLSKLALNRKQDTANATTEWVFPGAGGGAYERTEAWLSRIDCVAIVQEAVSRVLDAWPADVSRRLVVGTSGGGDSNVLLTALARSDRVTVVPIIVYGPDMEVHVRNAQELCSELGCPLTVLHPDETAQLAGIRSVEDFFAAFERHYPDADIDFPWTWLLRRTLAAAAREQGTQAIAIGANREDLLSEGFLRLARGLPPMPAPYRRVGSEMFVYPMCEVPKKIGDGAYPCQSLDNYRQRRPSISPGRSAFYQLAYLLGEHLPGMDVTLLAGFNQLGTQSADEEDPIIFDAGLGDHIANRMNTDEQRTRWMKFLDEVRTA